MTDFSPQAERARLIAMMEERNELGPLEDGYIYYWPSPNTGALGPHTLRIIADELDLRNAEWDKQVQATFVELRNREDPDG